MQVSVTINLGRKQHRIRPMSSLEGLRENVAELHEDEELIVSCSVDASHRILLHSTKLELVKTMTTRNILQVERHQVDTVLVQVHCLDSLSSKYSKIEC